MNSHWIRVFRDARVRAHRRSTMDRAALRAVIRMLRAFRDGTRVPNPSPTFARDLAHAEFLALNL